MELREVESRVILTILRWRGKLDRKRSQEIEIGDEAILIEAEERPQAGAWEISRKSRFARALPYLIILPSLLVTIPVLIPFVQSIYYSLTSFSLNLPNYTFIGLKQYQLLLQSTFWHNSSVTLRYALFAVGSELIFGLIIAMLLNTETILAKVFRPLLLLPLMVAPILATLMWKLMMNPDWGVLNYFLSFVGQREFPWISAERTAMFSVVMVDVWMFTPFVAILLLAGLRGMPKEPFEAARVDGASRRFIFWNLTLPRLMPFIVIAAVFRLIDSFKQFDIIFGLTKGGPGSSLMSYQVQAYTTAFTYTRIAQASALMLINWVIIYVMSMILIKYWGRAKERLS